MGKRRKDWTSSILYYNKGYPVVIIRILGMVDIPSGMVLKLNSRRKVVDKMPFFEVVGGLYCGCEIIVYLN